MNRNCDACSSPFGQKNTPEVFTLCGHKICLNCSRKVRIQGNVTTTSGLYATNNNYRCQFCRKITEVRGTNWPVSSLVTGSDQVSTPKNKAELTKQLVHEFTNEQMNNVAKIKKLLDEGADANATGPSHYYEAPLLFVALDCVLFFGFPKEVSYVTRMEIANALVNAGANIAGTDNCNRTAMMAAINWQRDNHLANTMKFLLDNGFKVECGLDHSLYEAVKINNIQIVKHLIEILKKNGGSLDRTVNSYTSLHLAAVLGHKDSVSILAENGAELKLLTDEGKSAQECAQKYGHTEIVDYLEEKERVRREELACFACSEQESNIVFSLCVVI